MSRYIDTLPTPRHIKPKKLIVLSAPRTGTLGLYLALQQLGFKPYHMKEVLERGPKELQIVIDGFKAESFHDGRPYGREDFDKWLADYDVIIEMPFLMLRSILKAYPDAKFLLTERDPEKWAQSCLNTMGVAYTQFNRLPMSVFKYFDSFTRTMDKMFGLGMRYLTSSEGYSEQGREMMVKNYKSYIAEVKRLVPPEQLKICRLEDGFGWNEICPYLGVPIPDTPWPQLHTADEFHTIVKPMVVDAVWKAMASLTTMVAFAAVGLWYAKEGLVPSRA
ncbi:P-loop containing nucleoside triphosphate hydrolase protein [Poronia punctata]|nr:P-loop containing nucleoside triphosphate hydrolase protein [Poronia punctata]